MASKNKVEILCTWCKKPMEIPEDRYKRGLAWGKKDFFHKLCAYKANSQRMSQWSI